MTTAAACDAGPASGRPSESPALPARATAYLLVVLTAACALAAYLLLGRHVGDVSNNGWATFALLATAAAVAQFFVVITPRNQSYHTTIVFLIPAALLLPPEFLPLVALVQHVPEWLKERYAWYIQGFNIANYALDLLAAWASAQAIIHATWLIPGERPRIAVAWLVAALVLVASNHVLLALMLRLGRGHSWRTSGLFTFESLSTDLGLAALGITLTGIWHANPWLVGLALTPLLLIHRSLAVPALEAEARIDAKTGLFNARHFAAAIADELDRARRFGRPLSLLMVDLDLLREINNSYGHLAGDAVLQGIAAVFRQELRHYDVPARFGGEEFSILLPETDHATALEIAERIRRSVGESEFEVETSTEPIRATISIGVAAFPQDGANANELIHQADVAVYRAKLQGRNRVLGASAEPLLVPTERRMRLAPLAAEGEVRAPAERAHQSKPKEERRRTPPHPDRLPGRFTASLAFALPLLLIRKTQEAYLSHTRRSVQKLREAAETIQKQNASLEHANQLLRERSMAAMESLAATVDARDAYTAGHSRRVQRLALKVGRQLGLARAELEVLGWAALFHDIGKLAVSDAILLKPGPLTSEEWQRMQEHAEEGARIIDRLGFLCDSVPAIRHHHERWEGGGYPAGLAGDEIPLGARIIHVVDALDSMLTTRLYRAGRPLDEAMLEVRAGAGTQFCPRCADALERVLATERVEAHDAESVANELGFSRETVSKAVARLEAHTPAPTAATSF